MATKKPDPEWREELRNSAAAAEAERRKESAKLRADIREILAGYAAAADEERRKAEEARRRFDERADKLLKSTRALEKTVGNFTNGEGKILEIECVETLKASGKIGDIAIDEFRENMLVHDGIRPVAEYDIIGFNGGNVVPAEVKRTLRPEDVRKFAQERLPAFARHFPDEARGKKVRGAIIYKVAQKDAKTGDDPVQLALDSGLILLQANAKNELRHITKAA